MLSRAVSEALTVLDEAASFAGYVPAKKAENILKEAFDNFIASFRRAMPLLEEAAGHAGHHAALAAIDQLRHAVGE